MNTRKEAQYSKKHGFSLIDTIIGTVIFALVAISIYQAYASLSQLIALSSQKAAASTILTEELEIIRNLPFEDVGLAGGVPNGILPQTKTIARNGKNYELTTIVRNIDDPFDGTIGGSTADVSLKFSAQVGDGGLHMSGNSTIFGDVYSNGPITGDTSGEITGEAWAAEGSGIADMSILEDAHGFFINDSSVGGDAYYQTISNTTVLGTEFPGSSSPASQDLPIQDSDISNWKLEAQAGGTIGQTTINGNTHDTLGPVKIDGDLVMRNNGRLTMTGAIWVTGNVTLDNSAVVELDESFSSTSGVLIVDGTISIDNSVTVCGSEGYNDSSKECDPFSGSYTILLSTNSSENPNNPAIELSNISGFKGILYAHNGMVLVTNNATLVEATGRSVRLENGAEITYGTGLFGLTIIGNPGLGDTSPGDYRLVELTLDCTNCYKFRPLTKSTIIAPKGLETSVGNGALFVRVFDANGQPVANADVLVENNTVVPAISFSDVTDGAGWLRLVDVPPSFEAYEITVTKSGHSTDQTYPPGEPSNPSPVKAHATVAADTITQISFAIDEVSTINISTIDPLCEAVGGIALNLTGSKLIGTDPDVIKYSQDFATDANGLLSLANMEWDTYDISVTDAGYDLAGSLPSVPLDLSPGITQEMTLVTTPKTASPVLVEVLDAATQLPVAQASVSLLGPGYTNTIDTGEGHWNQTDWSGGSGQINYTNDTRYYSDDGNIDTNNPAGELRLRDTGGGVYASSGYLESSTFDNGTTTNYFNLNVRPGDPPLQAGIDPVRIQVASNDDDSTWIFRGPDGTINTYYTPDDRTLHSIHSNHRYIRYRVELYTADTSVTPNISDIGISFASECIPPGQAYFSDTGTGDYSIGVTKAGYQDYKSTITISSGWQQETVLLTPL